MRIPGFASTRLTPRAACCYQAQGEHVVRRTIFAPSQVERRRVVRRNNLYPLANKGGMWCGAPPFNLGGRTVNGGAAHHL